MYICMEAIESTSIKAARGVSAVKELTNLRTKLSRKDDQKKPPEDTDKHKKNVCSKNRSPLNGENKNSASESLYMLLRHNYSSFVLRA